MMKSSRLRAASGAVLIAILIVACKSGDTPTSDFDDSVLRFVPADTPYLLATGEPLPDDLLDNLEPKVEKMLGSYEIMFREIFRAFTSSSNSGLETDEAQKFSALLEELTSLLSIQGMRDAGFARDSAMAVFGNGLLPVLRIELSDAKLFDDALVRIEEAAGKSMDVGELDGHPYRYAGDDEIRLIIAVIDGQAIFTFAPGDFDDDNMRTLLGLTLPKQSIASTSTIGDITDKYGFTNHYVGFVDAERILSSFIDAPTGLNAVVLAEMQEDASQISNVCKSEMREMATVAPRLVMGYTDINVEVMAGSLIVEMREDIAEGLTTISALVPGLGADPGGLVSFGMSLDLMALRDFYSERLDAIEADPYECEYFGDIQDGIATGRAALNQPMPPMVYGFRGFNVIVDNISGLDLRNNQPPDSVDASILVAMENAQSVVAMGAMLSPELAGLDLKPDGVPIKLDLPEVEQFAEAAYAAMEDDAIAISFGSSAESRVKSVLNADPVSPPPLMSVTMDAGKYYELIADAVATEDPNASSQLPLEAREAMRDAMLSIGDIYDRMVMDIRFTENGLEINSSVTLAQ